MCGCADVDALWFRNNNLAELTLAQWDALFLAGVGAGDPVVAKRQFVLQPVDGEGHYVRHARDMVPDQATPFQDMELQWKEFALCFSKTQSTNVQMLLQELSRHQVCASSHD